ncbi:hypothetical protein LWI28_028827 [Acer negundo]|uniref:Uncharacterized protein n=1 Tax=Acer negundo TaxID=4023 RepID=A0AAD5NKZ2_ACENE|nr:hypothetical protein LWI28_028827 [Acer negundo]
MVEEEWRREKTNWAMERGAPSSSLTFSCAVDAFDLQPSGRRLRPSAVVFFLQSSSSSTFSDRLLPSVVVVVIFLQLSSSFSTFSRHDVVNFKRRDLQPS